MGASTSKCRCKKEDKNLITYEITFIILEPGMIWLTSKYYKPIEDKFNIKWGSMTFNKMSTQMCTECFHKKFKVKNWDKKYENTVWETEDKFTLENRRWKLKIYYDPNGIKHVDLP